MINPETKMTSAEETRRQKIARKLREVRDMAPIPRGLLGNMINNGAVFLSRILLKFDVIGKENIPASNPYVLAANHETYIDGMWIGAFLPRGHFRHFCSLAASDLEYKHGLLGRVILRVGRGIRVDRYGSPIRGLIVAKKEVEKGGILLVHPEGTRTPDGNLGEFKDGASYVAFKARVPLIPVFLDGGYEVFNRHMKNPHPFHPHSLRRKTMRLIYGEPLLAENFKDAHEMTDALVAWMHRQHDQKKAHTSR